ncbi:hypothetical protein [Actinokineospora xionganensis]|uniref:SPW repeat-containing protein n=1 Tax=Actinokineospora xionganensis TaxID=2684470 RepID=A0ABR7L227_9PSEU|nr:hypothetical protein [Actinokineospora xionganensis]MBC6446494.1 hypothetical protein [Actinokineospora xionganensis]
MSLPPLQRPRAVDGAFACAVAGSALAAVLLGVADRSISYLGLGAAVAAVASLALAFPMRTGRSWARIGLFVSALIGVLCAPAVANAMGSAAAPVLGAVLVAAWAVVIALLARADVRDYVMVRDMRG